MSRTLALVALAVLAQGCRQPDAEPERSPSAAIEQGPAAMSEGAGAATGIRLSYWGVGIPAPDGPVGGAAARLDGVLAAVGGCLVVETDGGVRVHPVFPAGKAQWNPTTGTLRFAGADYRPGDRITLGGGGVASSTAYGGEAGVEIAPCAVSDLWVVIA